LECRHDLVENVGAATVRKTKRCCDADIELMLLGDGRKWHKGAHSSSSAQPPYQLRGDPRLAAPRGTDKGHEPSGGLEADELGELSLASYQFGELRSVARNCGDWLRNGAIGLFNSRARQSFELLELGEKVQR
jgi:hypothetical protein